MAPTVADQRILWPAYIYPDWWNGLASAWTKWANTAPTGYDRTGSIAVMNPGSGPGAAISPDYTAAVNYARNLGHSVIGYTHTSYAARPVADVMAEVDQYYAWYGVDGVFVDEMSNNAADATYYRGLYSYIKTKPGAHLVVGNPGAAATTDWQVKAPKSADTIVIFENAQATYATWTPPAWTNAYPPSTFAHLVHACAAADLPATLAHSDATRAGYRYVTDDVMPNPWDTLGHWPAQASP